MYYIQLFEANKDSFYSPWKTLNQIINPKKYKGHSQIPKRICNGKLINDKQDISDAMNVHFCDVDRKLQSRLEDCMLNFKDQMPAKFINSFFLTPINNEHTLLEIKSLKQNNAQKYLWIFRKIIITKP